MDDWAEDEHISANDEESDSQSSFKMLQSFKQVETDSPMDFSRLYPYRLIIMDDWAEDEHISANAEESDSQSSFKMLQSFKQVEPTTLPTTRHASCEADSQMDSSSLHPYRLIILDDCSEDELISGDDIPSELENQDTDLSMNRFVNSHDIFEDVTQDMADIQTDEAHHFVKVARQNIDSSSDSDDESFVEEIVEVIHYSIKSLQSRDHVEQITLPSTRRETNETEGSSRLHPYRLIIMDHCSEEEQVTEDDIPSERENRDNGLNSFVKELDPKSFEGVTQGIVDEQTAVTTTFAKVAQQKMDIGSESDEESYTDDIKEVRRYSFKSLQSVNQVKQITLPSTKRASSETNKTVDSSSLHPYSLTIMDDWSEDELISEDDIPAEIENQDTDLGMNSFLSELVQKILEGVKQDKLHTEDDILSELQNQNNDLSFVIEPVQKTIEEVEQDKLHTEDDNLSELQNQDNDLSINSFVNEFVQNVIELAIRNTSVEHKATAKIDTSFATQQKMDNSPKKSEMSGSEDESDFEDFLQEMLSSINMMIQSMNKGESAKLPSASETSITTDTHTSLIPSHTDKHAHTANSSSPHWNITRARSAPCLQQLSEHNRVTLHKALSDTTILQAKHVTPIMDFSDIQFLKVNSSIAEDKIVRTVNQYPGIQADKPVGADLARIPINAMSTISILPPVEAAHVDIPLVTVTPGAISIPPLHTTPTIVTDNVSATIDKTSNGITSAIVDIPSTSATPVTMSNIQVPCNDTKKSSIVKRARIRVSYAFRRMTRLLTACSSGRESTKKSHWRPSKQHSAINMEDDSQPTV